MGGPSNGGRRGRPPRTLKVRMMTSIGWNDETGRAHALEANEEYSLPYKQAEEYLSSGLAEPVAIKPVERAETRG